MPETIELPANFQPRWIVYGNQLPRNIDGSLRPQMVNEEIITIHYTGGGMYVGLTRGQTLNVMLAIQSNAVNTAKPWEYNYVIDWQGNIWEYAGTYRAAHSSGENDFAVGVLMLVGLSNAADQNTCEPINSAMIQAYKELRAYLKATGVVAVNASELQHGQMPGAKTPCPGKGVKDRWGELLAPLPTPTPEPGDEMTEILWQDLRYKNVWYIGGVCLAVDEPTRDYYLIKGVEMRKSPGHDQMLKSVLRNSGLELTDLVPV